MPFRTYVPPIVAAQLKDRPPAGEYVPDRELLQQTTPTSATGQISLTFWTAIKSEPINTVRVNTSGTAAAATPTLCRMGIYSTNDAGDLTALLASTANDTTLFAAQNTLYSKALSSQFDKVAGVRYATALIVVSGAATPTFVGNASSTVSGQYGHQFELPAKSSRIISQADLGPSYTRAQQVLWPFRISFLLT